MQTWTLKKAPEDHALLAKLPEGVTLDSQKVMYMYHQSEDIQEKDTADPTEEKTAFIRKKRRRRSLRTKSTIRLEEPPKGNQVADFERVNLEGSIVDSSLEGISATKYALLQVVKKNGSVDPSDMTINVILVGDTYHFKNIVSTRIEKSLEELDNEYDKQLRLQKESNKRYHKISSALTRSDPNAEDDEGMSAFGSSNGRKKGTGSRKDSGVAFRGHMNDAGQDVDEEKNFDDFNGVGLEYEDQVSDDDDDAELLQGVDAEREENDVDGGDIFEDDDDDSDSSSDAVDEEEDEVDPLDSKDRALQQASSELSDFLSATKPSVTSSSSVSAEGGVIVVDRGGEGAEAAKGEVKEKRKAPSDLSADEEKNKKQRVTSASSSSSGTSLTEELVRQTITRMGGRVAAKNLAQELKKPIKKMGEAGKAKFREIVVKITQSEDDAVFGKVLVLKK